MGDLFQRKKLYKLLECRVKKDIESVLPVLDMVARLK